MGIWKIFNPLLKQLNSLLRRSLQVGIFIAAVTIILLVSSGDPGWRSAWYFIGLFILVVGMTAVIVPYANPGLIRTRANRTRQAKRWDRVVARLVAIFAWGLTPLIAGLDHRFDWTSEGLPLIQFGAIVLAFSAQGLKIWAMATNPFFTTLVIIQEDRKHQVCDRGPYRYIRHPGHLGMLILFLMAPFILESLWSGIPAFCAIGLLVLRTTWEDQTLRNQLSGYSDYTNRVSYRMIPGIW